MEVPCNTGDKKEPYCIVIRYYPPVKMQPPAFYYHGLKSSMPSAALYVVSCSLLFSPCYVLNTWYHSKWAAKEARHLVCDV
jgi:hypothetical protein